jgi:alpha,alpha-trehalase
MLVRAFVVVRGRSCLLNGVHRALQQERRLRQRGADIVVSTPEDSNARTISRMSNLPRIFDRLDEFTKRLNGRSPAVFLDYDGTLTPIVQRPEMAVISAEMQEAVRDLAGLCMVAVVSGRDRADVEERVGLNEIVYAGSHGFDIKGPPAMSVDSRFGEEFIPTLDDVEKQLETLTKGIDGAQIERKIFSIAVHYRNVAESDAPAVEAAVDAVINDREGLRKGHGKKVFEVQPDIDWHKGKAVLWLIDALKLDSSRAMPIYIGDDVTDEDAFKALQGTGLGVVVEVNGRASAAEFQLADVDEVRQFLEWLANHLRAHAPS